MEISDCGETQADFSEVFPDLEGEEERSGDFYNTPASPITVPYCPRPPSTGSQKSPRPRRQRTTSINQSYKKTATESIIRTKHRTIYTAGRPPWYNSAGQQVEPFIIRTKHRTIYTAGRPPWYNSAGQQVEPFVIGICGGSASGKTTVAQKIIEYLGIPWVTLLSMDSFYKVLNEKQHEIADRNEYNFDHPDAFDFELLIQTLQRLKEGRKVEVPIYNFVTHSRETRTTIEADFSVFSDLDKMTKHNGDDGIMYV
ncbi:Phosphoribulokinase / Uridine kinase family [Popillia japonica]|uniref:Phosphoribulokinase / Uridine kinase family n=1 Tax=Popillia japonica TaxID=7064 RepID=A0AAW1IEQ4_POPJA